MHKDILALARPSECFRPTARTVGDTKTHDVPCAHLAVRKTACRHFPRRKQRHIWLLTATALICRRG